MPGTQAWEPILRDRLYVSVGGCAPLLSMVASDTLWVGERERSTPTHVTALPTPPIGLQKQSQFQIIVFTPCARQ